MILSINFPVEYDRIHHWFRIRIRYVSYRRYFGSYKQVCSLTCCDRAVCVADTQSISSVDGSGVDGLCGRKPHLDTGERKHHLHIARRSGAGVEVCCQSYRQTAVYHLFERSVWEVEEERTTRKPRRHSLRAFESLYLFFARRLKMVYR